MAIRPGLSKPSENNEPLSEEELKNIKAEIKTLFEDGILSPAQARKYGSNKQRTGAVINGMLKEGAAKEHEIVKAFAPSFKLDAITDLEKQNLDIHLTDYLTESVAKGHKIVPIDYDASTKEVSIAIPLTAINTRIDIQDLATRNNENVNKVRFVLASREGIARQIEKLYRGERRLEAMAARKAAEEAESNAKSETTIIASDDSDAEKFVQTILTQAIEDGASDIHFEPGEHEGRVRFRTDGVLSVKTKMLQSMVPGITNAVKNLSGIDIAKKRSPNDGRLSITHKTKGVIDFRVATMPVAIGGEQIVMRLLDNSQASVQLSELGFSEENLQRFSKAYNQPYGMVLVTGPTGSGKSTTLYATLNQVTSEENKIITVENPVEYTIDGINQVQINPEAKMTFPNAIKAILRSDPDILLVGEIRDPETAEIAVEAGLTGHLLLSTLHTNDAPSAVIRMTEMGIEPFLVGNVMNGVLAQRLLRRLCKHCKREVKFNPDKYKGANIPEYIMQGFIDNSQFEAVGCHECTLGYKGRLGVHEVMLADEEIQRLTMSGATPAQLRDYATGEQEMKTMREDGLLKAIQGITSIEEVYRVIKDS